MRVKSDVARPARLVQSAATLSLRLELTAVVCIAAAVTMGSALAHAAAPPFTVGSSLADGSVLAHRTSWVAKSSIPSSAISQVDFLIDGKLRWIEHATPYVYGDTHNYLVTSWLTPGVHRFLVRAIATDGRRASTVSVARVRSAPAAPARLAARWTRRYTDAETGGAPAGVWTLTIDRTGWKIRDPGGGGNYLDVAYLRPGLVETRSGIWTRPHSDQEGNGWCEETNQPVRFSWTVAGDSLTFTRVGPSRCDGLGDFLSRTWTRAG